MKVVTGLYDTYRQAEDAVAALKEAGISSDDITLVSRDPAHTEESADTAVEGVGVGSGLGLLAGGGAGLLTGLGLIAIPGVGPVVAAGWLVATLAGAAAGTVVGGAAGGLIGALTGSDVSEADAHVYAEGVRRGGTLVSARVHEDRAEATKAILDLQKPVDIEGRRQTYAEGGWERFDETAVPPQSTPLRPNPLQLTPSVAPGDIAALDEDRVTPRTDRI